MRRNKRRTDTPAVDRPNHQRQAVMAELRRCRNDRHAYELMGQLAALDHLARNRTNH